ncbi:MAG: YYY membrane protein [Candidatus Woesebacteria bacterium GW2011_GWB1_39_12]|uniref:YYY membrane protein n=2 Tax=Candidatus Woeseibacteriota TaxID=1752722 RepID=A0A0G0M001_9BACT|nr:MAG: YYY membrane protein [Candidatus Woesebacteria bacterium GW2011_GWA1_39_12]KKR01750.1 MAG: YYY membrane protein [Candidatus Woesebacteria bacterium GW2011_GWB1_39_12]
MNNDLIFIFGWWLNFFFAGLINLPLTIFIFKKFRDAGYGFSKTFGSLLIAYIIFLGSITHLFGLTQTFMYAVVALVFLFNVILFFRHKDKLLSLIKKNLRIMIFQEILFTLGLILWSYVRAHQSDINGLEKFMDLGFINSILRSKYLPPPDMWFSGKPINYYWFGHFWVAVVTKFSGIPSYITYNLMLATILGFTLTGAFSIASTLVKALNLKINKRAVLAAGIISAILLSFAGNFHTPIYILKEGRDKYWYPDATRFIGYNPETNDKTIHEFPIYSFVVSDLHAHLINLPFVLLYIALLYNFLTNFKSFGNWKLEIGNFSKLIPLGFILGVMFMTSAWDFGNYALTTGVVLTLFTLKRKGLNFSSVFEIGVSTASILLIGLVVSLPFLLNFESIAQGIALVKARTPVWQLGVLWGFPALLTLIFGLVLLKKWPKLKKPDIFVAGLLVSSWILIFLPEVIYVKDIYIASHHRANTMFKLTYQAFVMSYLASGYIVIRSLTLLKKFFPRLLLSLFYLSIFAALLRYPFIATKSYYADLKTYRGLSGETWLENQNPDIFKAIVFLRENVKGQPVILEAPGDSYTEFNSISSYTGLPTVSGWFVHEWLWRGTSEIPQARVADITQIYTSEDPVLTKNLLKKYNVSYVIIGSFEREKYSNLIEEKFTKLGQKVFSSPTTKIYQID